MTITPIAAFNDNYIWAMLNPTTRTALIVDPGDAQPVIDFFTAHPDYTLTTILITHHHDDHMGGVAALQQQYAVTVYAPAHAKNPVNTVVVDKQLQLSDFGTFKVFTIPAHTLEHVAYYQAEQQALFCGDTLFSAGCGRVFEGTYAQMHTALQLLNRLPTDTRVYCGHEYTVANLKFALAVEPNNSAITTALANAQSQRVRGEPTLPSTLAFERQVNPFLRCDVAAVAEAAAQRAQKELSDSEQVFEVVRRWKNEF